MSDSTPRPEPRCPNCGSVRVIRMQGRDWRCQAESCGRIWLAGAETSETAPAGPVVPFRCVSCHDDTVPLDDAKLPSQPRGTCICLRCWKRDTHDERPLDQPLRGWLRHLLADLDTDTL